MASKEEECCMRYEHVQHMHIYLMKASERSSTLVLSTIENFVDTTLPDKHIPGTLALIRSNNIYHIHWCPLDGTETQSITAVFDYLKKPDNESWVPGKCFNILCTKISNLSFKFSEGNSPYIIKLATNDLKISAIFELDVNETISLSLFIEQLLVNGIAVPSISSRYSLVFYENSHPNTYLFSPAHIQMRPKMFKSIEEFWNNTLEFFQRLIILLDATNTFPADKNYPISIAARAIHSRIVEKIDKFVKGLPKYEPVTAESFHKAFDENGKLIDPEIFKLRLFHSSCEREILPEVIPFAVGIYHFDSTSAEREEIDKQIQTEFNQIREQEKLLLKDQISHNIKLTQAFRIIDHDVARTDRGTAPFKNANSPGLTMLTTLLRLYVIYNPPISYLQGMNDLFVPIITTYIQNWSPDGVPLDKDGNELDYEKLMPIMFWSFDAMLKNTNHIPMLENITERCTELSEQAQDLLQRISPIASIWMKRNNLANLLWFYSDFVLMFKRSFDNIWPTWLQFNCSPNPENFLVYFITAMVITAFDQFATLPDVSMTATMDAFPKILSTLDAHYVGEVALWVSINYPTNDPKQQSHNTTTNNTEFEFFPFSW